MSAFKAYERYKQSGVEWLGEVPEHWEITPLKWYSNCSSGENIKNETLLKSSDEQNNIGAYGGNGFMGYTDSFNVKAPVLIVGRVGALCGNVHLLTNDAWVSDNALILRVGERFYLEFLTHVLRSRDLNTLASKTAQPLITSTQVCSEKIPLPPTSEQTAIAQFLDQKTAQIDALIAKKQQLLNKLAEQRTALISHAVTKGLNPNAPLKNSGVEWLGDVPEHWEVKRLKFLVSEPLKYGANESAELTDTDLPRYIRITDVKDDGSLWDDTFRSLMPEVAEEYLLSEGDILLARSGATVGKNFIYRKSWGIAAYAGYLIRARMDVQIMNADFTYLFLQSHNYWSWLRSVIIQATIQNVSAEKYNNVFLPVPPLHEQDEIISTVNTKTAELDQMATKVKTVIQKLKEYRAALITQAVTGKIDVRSLATKES